MRRIVTVTANAALDWTCFVAGLEPGARHLVRRSRRQAGGKGVNVARTLAELGRQVRSVVVVGGTTGDAIVRDLERSDLDPIAVVAEGQSRTCLEIVDEGGAPPTQIHEVGVEASTATADALVAAVELAIGDASWLAICGSLARGLPVDLYARLIRAARSRGVRTALDASGDALVEGVRAGPDLLRINRDEAAALGDSAPAHPLSAARQIAHGVVSAGSGEILAWSPQGCLWRVVPPRVLVRNPIGCGDAMLAGLLSRIDSSAFEEALRFATALASADAESDTAGRPCPRRAGALLGRVEIIPIDPGR